MWGRKKIKWRSKRRQTEGEKETVDPWWSLWLRWLTSALLTKEDVLALNTFFLHELLKITQRQGCTLFCCRREEFPPAAP